MKINKSALLLLVFCLATSALFGCQTTSPQGVRPMPPEATTDNERIGDMFLQSNKLDEALLQYDIAMEQGANRSSVAFRKGFVYLAKSMWQEALDWFTVAIGNDPTMTLAYEGAGKATLEMGHLRNAAAFFEGAVQHSPDYWVPHIYLAAIYNAIDRDPEAMQHSEIARNLVEPGDNSIYMTLAVAQKRAESALEMNPEEALEWSRSFDGTTSTVTSIEDERTETVTPLHEPMDELPAVPEEESAMAESEEPDQAAQEEVAEAEAAETDMAANEAEETEETADDGQEHEMAPMPSEEPDQAAAEHDQNVLDEAVESARQEAGHGDEDQGQVAIAGGAEEEAAEPPAEEPVQVAAAEEPAPVEEPAQAAPAPSPTVADETAAEAAMPPAQGQEVASLDPSGYSYSILESSWRTEEEARVRTSDLMDMGITANIVPVNLPEKGLWYRVMIGEYANLDVAERMKVTLVDDFRLSHLNILRDGRFFQTVE